MVETDEEAGLWVGRTLAGRYEVVRKLNQGGMGAVFLAMQRPLERPVALKLLLRAHADDPTAIRRFEKEARAVSKLTHPHVVTLYDFGTTETGDLYIAMEYLHGVSLREAIERDGAMAWDRALHIVRGVTSALVAAHEARIVHRDLKPENIMLVERSGDADFPKVLDFGLARTAEPDARGPVTQRDIIPGTPAYMSPERANGISDDPRSDLYALGAVWFELMTGRAPFEAESSIKVILQHIHEPPPVPSRVRPNAAIPEAVDALVLALLAKRPDDRPASAAVLLEMLEGLHRPRGWHVASPSTMARQAIADEGVKRFVGGANDIDDLSFSLLEDEPVPLTRRKTSPPVLGVGLPRVGTPAPSAPPPKDTGEEPVVLLTPAHRRQDGDRPDLTPPGAMPPAEPATVRTEAYSPVAARKPRSAEQLTPSPGQLRIHSIAEVAQHLAGARNVAEVGELCVAFLATRFDRAAVVDLRERFPVVVSARGMQDVTSLPSNLLRTSGLMQMMLRKDAYYGPAPSEPEWLSFFRGLGGNLPGAILVATLKRGEAPAFLFYGDHRDLALRGEVKDCVLLLREAASALSSFTG